MADNRAESSQAGADQVEKVVEQTQEVPESAQDGSGKALEQERQDDDEGSNAGKCTFFDPGTYGYG
jgi:hypothetical protein